MKLIFVTQDVDPEHAMLGATVAKLRALAAEVDEVAVLALAGLPDAVPPNCRVRTFGARTRIGRGLRYLRLLAAELRGADAVVAHMCPIYALLAAPLARPLRVPVSLWYAHWHATATLRAATAASTRIVSVDDRSFPLATGKLAAIGHGVDFSDFGPVEPSPSAPLRLLALGRYSPAKGLETVVRAVALVPDTTLVVHGPATTPEEQRHRRELHDLVEELGLAERVTLASSVPRTRIPELHRRADVLVNNMRAGAPDKVVYEACGSGLLVLASNPSFEELVRGVEPPLLFPRDSPAELAARLRALAALGPAERREIGVQLRRRVLERHSVEAWARRLVAAVTSP